MEISTNIFIFLILTSITGVGLGVFIQRRKNTKELDDAKSEAKDIVNQAKREGDRIKSEKMLQAKERFIELKSEHEKVIFQREKKISELESLLRVKENKLNNDLSRNKKLIHSLEQKNESIQERLEKLDSKQKEIDTSHKIQVEKLETISGLSADEAKNELIDSLKKKAQSEAMAFAQQSLEEAKLTVEQEAKKIIINTIQRIGTEESIENCVSVSNLDSDVLDAKLYDAASNVGFFALVNAPFVTKDDIDRQFEFSEKFFARAKAVKEQESPYNAKLNSGYEYKLQVRPSTQLKDEKESFQVTAKESSMETRWPKDMGPDFEANTREFMGKSLELAKMVIARLQRERRRRRRAQGGEEEDEEDIASKHSLWVENESQCTLRMIHYPPFDSVEEAEDQAKMGYMRAGAHTDWCNVTLLYQRTEFGNGGLECAANPRRDGFENTEWAQIRANKSML